MTFLIDSHVALWWETGDATLNSSAREEIEDPSTEVWCSVASLWELAIKVRAGKLILDVAIMVERLGEDRSACLKSMLLTPYAGASLTGITRILSTG